MKPRDDSEELLELAQEAGRLGIFEWHVESGDLRLSPNFLALYGLAAFDGRFATWRARIFREDQIRVGDLIERAFESGARELNAEFRITRANDASSRAVSPFMRSAIRNPAT